MFTKAIVTLVSCFSFAAMAAAESIEIDESQAVMLGSGCELTRGPNGLDAQILANGTDISVIATGLNQSLGILSGGALASSKSCSIRIPMSIRSGLAVQNIREALTFGLYKSEGTAVALSALVVVANAAPKALSLKFPLGVDSHVGKKRVTRRTSIDLAQCPSAKSLVRINLASSAQLEDSSEYVDLATDDGDLRYDVSVQLGSCAR